MSQKSWTVSFAPMNDGVYRVTVRRSGSVHWFDTRLPPDISDLWTQSVDTPDAARSFRRDASDLSPEEMFFSAGNMLTLKTIGERITDALFGTSASEDGVKVLGALEDRVADAEGIELRLDLSQTPELSGIPWEAAYLKSKDRFLAIATTSNIVRRLDAQSELPPPVSRPIRILVAAANPHKDLNTSVELGNIEQRIAQLIERGADQYEIRSLPAATREAFRNTVREWRPHIIHYIGHSAFREGMGYLYFEGAQDGDGTDRMSAEDLRNMLLNDRPWLVVLNSCESGATSREAPMGGVAQNLLGRLNIPFVVGMQQPVSDDAAICFSQAFYAALTDNHTIADAVSIGRNAISTQADELTKLELITPALYTSGETDRIAFVESPVAAAAAVAAGAAAGSAVASEPVAAEGLARHWKIIAATSAATAAIVLAGFYLFADPDPRMGHIGPPVEDTRNGIAAGPGSDTEDNPVGRNPASLDPGQEDGQQTDASGPIRSGRDARSGLQVAGDGDSWGGSGTRPRNGRIARPDGPTTIPLANGDTLQIFADGRTIQRSIDPETGSVTITVTEPDGTTTRRRLLSAARVVATPSPALPPLLQFPPPPPPRPPDPIAPASGGFYAAKPDLLGGLEIHFCAGLRARTEFATGSAAYDEISLELFPFVRSLGPCDPRTVLVTGFAPTAEENRYPGIAERRADAVEGKVNEIHQQLNGRAEIFSGSVVSDYEDDLFGRPVPPRRVDIEFYPRGIEMQPDRMVRIDFAPGQRTLSDDDVERLRPFSLRQKDGSFPDYRIIGTLDPRVTAYRVIGEIDPSAVAPALDTPALDVPDPYEVAEARVTQVASRIWRDSGWRNFPWSTITLPNLAYLPDSCEDRGDCALQGGGAVHVPEDGMSAAYESVREAPGAIFVELLGGATFNDIETNADPRAQLHDDPRYGAVPHMVTQESVEPDPGEQGAEPGLVPQGDK